MNKRGKLSLEKTSFIKEKNKRANSRLHFNINNNLLKCKRSQTVFGMPYSVIFSLFLIAVFIAVAFFAIRYFLNIQRCNEEGLFINDLQNQIRSLWSENYGSITDPPFTRSLPSGTEYVCFGNLQEASTGNTKEKEIYNELRKNADFTANMFFYPQKEACVPSTNIQHAEWETNLYCFEVEQRKVRIKMEKGRFDDFVSVFR